MHLPVCYLENFIEIVEAKRSRARIRIHVCVHSGNNLFPRVLPGSKSEQIARWTVRSRRKRAQKRKRSKKRRELFVRHYMRRFFQF